MSQEQINALFYGRDSIMDQREVRINSLQNNAKEFIKIKENFKTDSIEYDESRPTNQSENMMMITREEYVSLQQEYERRKDMEEKYKEDINTLRKKQLQQDNEVEQLRQDNEILRKQSQNKDATIQTLIQQIQELRIKEQNAQQELTQTHDKYLQAKQQLELFENQYNVLQKQSKYELERKEKQIDQLKNQIIYLNEPTTQRQEKQSNEMSQSSSAFKSSILFQKDKPIQQIQVKSNYDSKAIINNEKFYYYYSNKQFSLQNKKKKYIFMEMKNEQQKKFFFI
ncbi:hypothetical protein pb186bvf_006707 [Paramecium bursaria]